MKSLVGGCTCKTPGASFKDPIESASAQTSKHARPPAPVPLPIWVLAFFLALRSVTGRTTHKNSATLRKADQNAREFTPHATQPCPFALRI